MTRIIHHSVSLFSNCGAGDIGYAKAGFKFDVMAELDPRRLDVCLLNHPGACGVPGDLRATWPRVIEAYRRRAKKTPPSLLAACPPCQGMSTARSDRGHEDDPDAGMKDDRNLLVTVISRVAQELAPRLIVVENVQAFLTRQVRNPVTLAPISAAKLLIEELEGAYFVFPFLSDLCDFGVPQTRKRTFLTFVRSDEPCLTVLQSKDLSPYPAPRYALDHGGRPVFLRDALKGFKLPPLDAGSPQTASSRRGGGLHCVPVWLDRRYEMVAAIPRHKGGSAWQSKRCKQCGPVDAKPDDAICARCRGPLLRPVVQNADKTYRLVTGFRSSTYRRMKSAAPAATITTASGHIGSNHTIHPFENRLLSALECALLQTLPRQFKWGDALRQLGHTNIREMIGEAVPPLFTRQHGKALVALLGGARRKKLLSSQDARCKRARKKLGLPKQLSSQ